MKNFISLFDCPVFVSEHENIENKKIKKYILDYYKTNKGRKLSNSGGFQSDNLNFNQPELQDFFKSVIMDLNYYFEKTGGNSDAFEVMITDCWFNINGKNSFNWPHKHDGYLSAVYYVDADEDTGDLIFSHPSSVLPIEWKPSWFKQPFPANSSKWPLKPKSNKCYIFPSWLEHYVETNNTNKTRISIALNTTIVEKGINFYT